MCGVWNIYWKGHALYNIDSDTELLLIVLYCVYLECVSESTNFVKYRGICISDKIKTRLLL